MLSSSRALDHFLNLATNCAVYAGRNKRSLRSGSSLDSKRIGERIEILNFALLDFVVKYNFGTDYKCLKLESSDSNTRIDFLFCQEDDVHVRGDLVILRRTPLLIGESRRSATAETLSRNQLETYVERSKSFDSAFVFVATRSEENAWKNSVAEEKDRILALELTSAHNLGGGSLVPCFVEDVEYLTRLHESEEIDYRVIQAHLKLASVFSFWQKFKNHVNRFSLRKEKTLEIKARVVKIYDSIDLSRKVSAQQILQFSEDCKELRY